MLLGPLQALAFPQDAPRLPRPRRLDSGVEFRRDPATGELRLLRAASRNAPAAKTGGGAEPAPRASPDIRVRVNLVEVNCNVLLPDGRPLRGLRGDDFRVFEDGVEQPVAHFDASTEPASVVLVLDVSPSVLREWSEMRRAARVLATELSPRDEVAVVAFASQAHLILPFTRDRALLDRAIASLEVDRQTPGASGSIIYESVFLAADELFAGRQGRKAILLVTDGQDSGLGLGWSPASAVPRGASDHRLTFEDLCRALAAAGVEVHVVSTQSRPKEMTDAWLTAHRDEFLLSEEARRLGMPHYTLYLAELVRRAGGRLYFLRELGSLAEVYARIAESIGTQYTLGYYPQAGASRPGWRAIRVELTGRPDAVLRHRVAYYVPASQ